MFQWDDKLTTEENVKNILLNGPANNTTARAEMAVVAIAIVLSKIENRLMHIERKINH